MQVLIITLQILIGWFLFQILREIKLTKCAINRLERLRKHLSFNCINKNKSNTDKGIELFPIKNFGLAYQNEQKERLAELIDSEAAVNLQFKTGTPL